MSVDGGRAWPSAPWRLYVIERASARELKIGIARDVGARCRAIQAHHGEPLVVLLDVAGGREQERALHARFAAHRKRGEWFRDVPEIRGWLASVAQ